MAQSDQTIQNDTFPQVRADINDNLAALFSQSSGPSEPETTVKYQTWVHTLGPSNPGPYPIWKIRNAANEDWITIGVLDPSGFEVGGVTSIANGGTGQTTVAAAIAALLPSQTGNADKALVTNGTSLLWSTITSSSFTKYTFAAGTGTGSTRTHLWTKPSSGSTAVVLIWGGGGAGGRDGGVGGGGGAGSNCGFGLFPLADLGSTETITIGRGGQSSSATGTNSTFGSHVTSYGGRGGDDNGGETALGSTPFAKGVLASPLLSSQPAFDLFSGGNGGRQQGDNDSGGNAVFGGAGGGNAGINDSVDPPGGTSIIAGNGGRGNRAQGDAVDGSTPGGGGGGAQGGTAGLGGNGECWVLIF
jgi:hypothetical protein